MIAVDFFGKNARFHHVGMAVGSIRAIDADVEIVDNQTQGVRMAFVDCHGATLELLEPLGERSPIARSVKQGIKLLHLCFEVPDVDEAVAACRASGFHRISQPTPVPEYENRRIVWVFSKDYGLVELVEDKPYSS
ncbi:MAG: VOC family protein [Acidobacteriota bacterium]|nr:MAG: VOC family protein [Acidobacteriota bacterium]